MKRLALALAMFVGCATAAQAAGDASVGQTKAATCVACHGADGNATVMDSYPKLAGQHAGYLEKQLKEFKLGMTSGGESGRVDPVMGGMAMPLSDQDIADISAFYASLKMTPEETPESAIALGEKLYRGGDLERNIAACAACHSPRGNGSNLSGFPKISGQNAEYIKLQLVKFRDGSRNNDMNGMMRDIAVKLTDADIDALSKYVGGLH